MNTEVEKLLVANGPNPPLADIVLFGFFFLGVDMYHVNTEVEKLLVANGPNLPLADIVLFGFSFLGFLPRL